MNKSLLGKWNWRLAAEDNPPWKNLIKLKYGLEEGGWFLVEPKGSFGVSLWKDIRREAHQLKQDCKLILGDEDHIRFWEDKWCVENLPCASFTTLYAIVASKGVKVGKVWKTTEDGGGWNMRFIKPFNDWESEETQRLISLISSRDISQREKDKIFWLVDKKGQYTMKANYRHLEGDLSGTIPTCLIWNSCVPPKVSVFIWEAWWGKVLTMDQLKKRAFSLQVDALFAKRMRKT